MRRYQKGFSLIEMLAVVFVVVLLTSLVSLNVGSGSADINRENQVRDVAAMLGYYLTEAELSGTDHGLLIHRLDGFDDALRWALVKTLRSRLGGTLSLNTAFEDLVFESGLNWSSALRAAPVDFDVLEEDANPPPQIILFAGGEVTPVDLIG